MTVFVIVFILVSIMLFGAFLLYKSDMEANIDNLKGRLEYAEKVNYRLKCKIDKIYNELDKLLEKYND